MRARVPRWATRCYLNSAPALRQGLLHNEEEITLAYTWTDHLEIGRALAKAHPDDDPWTMPFPELKAKVVALADFGGSEDDDIEDYELEGIQSAWGWGKED
jgi:FeS assembly protein IscX